MMDLLLATSGGEAQAASGGYVDDVFSAYTYTGNGSTQTINNGIDLAWNGGLVWIKGRNDGAGYHRLFDTSRGATNYLDTATSTSQSIDNTSLMAFSSNGFSLSSAINVNRSGDYNYASWTFRKSPKFFDVVTYTGNGASNRALSHQLNADVGMVMVKATSTTGDWWVFHRSATGDLVLNTTAAQTASKANIPSATSSTFTVNGSANTNGVQYVAYLFAHDTSADGIIQAGSYVGNGSASGQAISLGFEPQYLMVKAVSSTGDWRIADTSRGMSVDRNVSVLMANLANAEGVGDFCIPTATGFMTSTTSTANANGVTYIYLAIRRSNKPPTSGTQVYNAIARTGANSGSRVFTGVGFPPDMVLNSGRTNLSDGTMLVDRLRGGSTSANTTKVLRAWLTNAETDIAGLDFSATMDGIKLFDDGQANWSNAAYTYINHFFKRAKGFFDIVCWDQVSGGSATVPHSLGVIPEMIITKQRNGTRAWDTYHNDWPNHYLRLNESSAPSSSANFTEVTNTSFRAALSNSSNNVAYLFATLAGISKVGSYTGNGTSQTINCGFATGARFILVKRTDATGDWYVWDSVRGIIAANDPHLSLNTTAAEVTTDDSVDPEASGFIVNQNTATNINVNGGKYIFLAIS